MSSSETVETEECANFKVPEVSPAPQPAKLISESPPPAIEVKSTNSAPPVVAQTNEDAGSLAENLFARLRPFLSAQYVEVEARLCNFSAPQKTAPAPLSDSASSLTPRPLIVKGPYGCIQVGVSAEDFTRMRTFVESTKKLPMRETQTEDIVTRDGRHSYAIAEDGTETFIGCVEKKRLGNVELRVPNCPYDIRLSVSTEIPRTAQTPPAVKPHGFVRHKRRWTATEATFEYAFTRVGGSTDRKTTFEVEIEGVHANAQDGVTVVWLEELLDRLLALARLEGNIGLPKSTYPAHRERKRPR